MQWFHRMELLARLGVVEKIPELKRQIQTLEGILAVGQGMFTKRLNHPYFQKWGAYTGFALEKDWRINQRRINDLTFRSLLNSALLEKPRSIHALTNSAPTDTPSKPKIRRTDGLPHPKADIRSSFREASVTH